MTCPQLTLIHGGLCSSSRAIDAVATAATYAALLVTCIEQVNRLCVGGAQLSPAIALFDLAAMYAQWNNAAGGNDHYAIILE